MKARLGVSLRGVDVRRGHRRILQDITWQLLPRQRWALIGNNGAGKTQLLKLLCGDVWPVPGVGSLSYRLGADEVDLIEAKSRIAYIGGERQDKYARYGWNLTVRQLVTTGLHRSDLLLQPATPKEAKLVSTTLRAAGMTRLAGREFLSLSYGEKRLALLARALVQDPDWLFLDEFYNGLDVHFRRRINDVLSAARRGGQSWVVTAHRAADIPRGTRSLLELADGRVRAIKRLSQGDMARMIRVADEGAPAALRSRPARRRAVKRGELMVELKDVDLYVEYRHVLQDLNWCLHCGEQWAVYGANGAGKSSFLKLLYGDLFPALGGKITRSGFPKGTPIVDWKRQVGWVSPDLQSSYAIEVTLLELVASGRHASVGLVDPPTAADTRAARRWLRFFKLLSVANAKPRELSYGQMRRALLARAMATEPRLLLLDEPLTGLDPRQRALMKRLLQSLMKRRVSIVAAVHHPEDLPGGMTHALRLHKRQAHLDIAT